MISNIDVANDRDLGVMSEETVLFRVRTLGFVYGSIEHLLTTGKVKNSEFCNVTDLLKEVVLFQKEKIFKRLRELGYTGITLQESNETYEFVKLDYRDGK